MQSIQKYCNEALTTLGWSNTCCDADKMEVIFCMWQVKKELPFLSISTNVWHFLFCRSFKSEKCRARPCQKVTFQSYWNMIRIRYKCFPATLKGTVTIFLIFLAFFTRTICTIESRFTIAVSSWDITGTMIWASTITRASEVCKHDKHILEL